MPRQNPMRPKFQRLAATIVLAGLLLSFLAFHGIRAIEGLRLEADFHEDAYTAQRALEQALPHAPGDIDLEEVFSVPSAQDLDVYLVDETQPAQPRVLFQRPPGSAPPGALEQESSGLRLQAHFDVGEKSWHLLIQPSAAYEEQRLSSLPWIALGLGLGFSLVLALVIAEREKARAALSASEESLRQAQAIAKTGSWTLDILGNRLDWSEETYRIFGIPPQTPMSLESLLERVHPDDRERVAAAWQAALRGAPYDLEHRILAQGQVKWVRERATLSFSSNQRPLVGLGTIQDITESKALEEELRRGRNLLQTIIDSTPDWIFIKNAEHRYQLVNEGYARAMGMTVQQMLGRDDLELGFAPDVVLGNPEAGIRGFWPDDLEVLETGQAKFIADEPARLDGKSMRLSTVKVPMKDDLGKTWGVLGFVHDITEFKEAQLKIQEAERFAQATLDALLASLCVVDEQGKILAVNQSWRNIGAIHPPEPPNACLGMNYLAICEAATGPDADKAAALAKGLRAVLRGELSEFSLEYPCHAPTRQLWFLARITRFSSKDGGRAVIAHHDITDRKEIEQSLYESEERLHTVVDNLTEGLVLAELDGQIRYWNRASLRLHGFDPTQDWLLGLQEFSHIFQLSTLDGRVLPLEEWPMPQIAREGRLENLELKLKRLDIDWERFFLYGGAVVQEPTGGRLMFLTMMDITERKLAEQALRQSELRYRSLFENMLEGYAYCRMLYEGEAAVDWIYLDVNPAFEAITGLENITGRRVSEAIPGLRTTNPELFEIYGRVARSGQPEKLETFVRELGVWFSLSVYCPHPSHFVAVFDDITERKRAELQLRKSEASYRLLAENMADVIWLLDPSAMCFTYISPSIQRLRGYTVEEVMAQSWEEVMHPEELSQLMRALPGRIQDFLAGNPAAATQAHEVRQRRKDGSWVWTEVLTTLIKDEMDSITILGVSRDISERKRTAQALEEHANHMKTLAQLSQAFLEGATDVKTVLDRVVRGVGGLFGDFCTIRLLSEDRQSFEISAFFHPDPALLERLAALRPIMEMPAQGGVPQHILENNHPRLIPSLNAEQFPFGETALSRFHEVFGSSSVAVVPLRSQSQPFGLMSVIRSATKPLYTRSDMDFLQELADHAVLALSNARLLQELQRHSQELERRVEERTADLKQTNEALTQALRAKDEFLANMSHELRTPLNGILALSEALEEQIRGPLNERQLKSVRTIESSGRHLLTLINDILDLSKIEAGCLALQPELVQLEELCQSSLAFIKEIATQKRLHVAYHSNDTNARLIGDPKRLKQILVNLLSNAVKFTEPNGSISLEVESNPSAETLRFIVQDSGIGIAPQDISRLFQPFTQLDASLTRAHEGTGLGLALVQRLVRLHDGEVHVESAGIPGQGSRFTVTLPWHPVQNQQRFDGLPQGTPLPSSAHHALIIEDSPSAAEQIGQYLRELGMQVTLLLRNDQALELVQQLRPGVIFLDLLMPSPSGWEILEKLKSNPSTSEIPVIIASVVDDPPRGLAAGASAYIVKPLSRDKISAAMGQTFQPAKLPQQAAILQGAPRILLAEDNEINVQAIGDYLQDLGCRLSVARDGQEALDCAFREKPDLILMDIQMPHLDGLEAIRRLRSTSGFERTPIIALTALAMPGDRERCLQAGATEYLSKPVSLKALRELLQHLLDSAAEPKA